VYISETVQANAKVTIKRKYKAIYNPSNGVVSMTLNDP